MDRVITAIRSEKRTGSHRSRLYLDGNYCCSLENGIIAEKSLSVGQVLTPAEIALLGQSDDLQRCLSSALRLLSYRARSEAETRDYLIKRGFEAMQADTVISRLREKGLLDDVNFARNWTEDRSVFKPRSRKVLKMELKRKGISTEIIDAAVAESDEEESARQIARRKARSLSVSGFPDFRMKLGAFLQRKGFEYALINRLIRETWDEYRQDRENEPGFESEDNTGD